MLSLENIQKQLESFNLSKVARDTGLSYPTVWSAANGARKTSYEVVLKLSDYLEGVAANEQQHN